jgi:hypothetical protein
VVIVNYGLLITSDIGIVGENVDPNLTMWTISISLTIPIGTLPLSVSSVSLRIIILPILF